MFEEYIGMNFRDWCALDEYDTRNLYIKLKTKNKEYYFKSEEEIEWAEMEMLRQSTIQKIDLIDDEWYIILRG